MSELHFPTDAAAIQGRVIRHPWMAAAIGAFAGLGRPIRMLEIGSWAGSSCATWGEALRRNGLAGSTIVCVDPWDGYISKTDIDSDRPVYRRMDEWAREGRVLPLFLSNAKAIEQRDGVRVVMMKGFSTEICPLLAPESFDLIYIDGSHYYRDALFDVSIGKTLVRDGGILSGDDLEIQLRDLPDAATYPEDVDVLTIPGRGNVHVGVTRAVGEQLGDVGMENGFWYTRREGAAFRPFALDTSKAFVSAHFGPQERAFIAEDIETGRAKLPKSLISA